jgi:hypothetical protein
MINCFQSWYSLKARCQTNHRKKLLKYIETIKAHSPIGNKISKNLYFLYRELNYYYCKI